MGPLRIITLPTCSNRISLLRESCGETVTTVVHIADTDEAWAQQTKTSLKAAFTDAIRLQGLTMADTQTEVTDRV